ncbi:retrovirus-related pol polyprotein from transposon TNT 1-94 [Tanacetum coccineum]
MYLEKAHWEKLCHYNIVYDKHDLANFFAPENDETIHLAEERQSKLSKIIKHFDYTKLNKLYDMFLPQKERLAEQIPFSNDLRMGDSPAKAVIPKTIFRIQPTKFAKHLDETQKSLVVPVNPDLKRVLELQLRPTIKDTSINMVTFESTFKEEMVEDLRYFNSFEKEVESFNSQLKSQIFEFSKPNDRLLKECMSKDIICTILRSFDDIDDYSNMAFHYLENIK